MGWPFKSTTFRRPPEEGGGFEERWWSTVNSPVFGPSGDSTYIVHRAEDVTEFVRLKQARAEQQELTKELQLRAEKMESEIFLRGEQLQHANESLRHVNEELQAANAEVTRLYEKTKELDELKTQFFANVSHELRTPLTLILGPAERMLAAPETTEDPASTVSRVIARKRARAPGLVDDLLDVSKLEAGQMALEYSETDLAQRSRARRRSLRLTRRPNEDRPGMLAMPGGAAGPKWMPTSSSASCVNLLSNAFKFTPVGGRMRLSMRSAEPDRVEVRGSGQRSGDPADEARGDLRTVPAARRRPDPSLRRNRTGSGDHAATSSRYIMALSR